MECQFRSSLTLLQALTTHQHFFTPPGEGEFVAISLTLHRLGSPYSIMPPLPFPELSILLYTSVQQVWSVQALSWCYAAEERRFIVVISMFSCFSFLEFLCSHAIWFVRNSVFRLTFPGAIPASLKRSAVVIRALLFLAFHIVPNGTEFPPRSHLFPWM